MRVTNLFDDAGFEAPSRREIKAALLTVMRGAAPMRVRRYRWSAYAAPAGRA